MELEFDFKEENSRLLGPVLRPVARIILENEGMEVPEYVYVDSGADITLISKSVGDLLGLKVKDEDAINEIKGVGERGVPVIIKLLNLKIGDKTLRTRVAWALIEDVPLLLGRADVFQFFDICFRMNKKTIFKEL